MPARPFTFEMNEAGQKWLDEFQRRRQAGELAGAKQCTFIPDLVCPRPEVGHLCGGAPPKSGKPRHLAASPAWVIFSTWQRPEYVPGQQLSLFDPPQIFWLAPKETGGMRRETTKRQWWVAVYYCKWGRDWAISNEKQMGARQVRVETVRARLKPGRRPTYQHAEFLHCGR